MRFRKLIILFAFVLFACTRAENNVQTATETPNSSSTIEITPTFTPAPTRTPVPATPTSVIIDAVCSPLENESLEELEEIITQPFKMPRSGNDDGHQGVDFAFFRRKDLIGIEGLGVNCSLPGTVVTILADRWPYGYAIIIETPLEMISSDILSKVPLLEIEPTVEPDPRVNCPTGELPFQLDQENLSLYILYGHLKGLPAFKVGDSVECSQTIGEVGNSGYSTNPHLHFETRIGPSGARFDSMAYYTTDSTESERYNYCVWRVSNLFQLFDPMLLLSIQK